MDIKEFQQLDADQRNRSLLDLLSKTVCLVTFTKVNGETRIMPCTLRGDLLPSRELVEHHRTTVYNPEVIRVWVTDIQQWRSFKVMNVTDIKVQD